MDLKNDGMSYYVHLIITTTLFEVKQHKPRSVHGWVIKHCT